MNYSVLCNRILDLDSKIRFVGVFDSKGETIAEKNRDMSSSLSADEEKMLVHYTFDSWRHSQNLEYRLGKARTSVAKHEKVTLISLYLDSNLLLLSVEPDYSYPEIIKKIRAMLDDGGSYPYEKKKQTKKDLDEKIAELEAKVSKLSVQLNAKPAETKGTILSQSSKSPQKTRKKSTATAVKRKTTKTSKPKKKTAAAAKRSKPASKAKRRAILAANKRKRELAKANNKIKSLKKAIRLAEKSAKKKKATWQQAVKRVSQIR